ncbi:MAG: glyoxalase/bleomycin resistance/extradiol dioxygenase family protein [Spirosomataceae bacterium]
MLRKESIEALAYDKTIFMETEFVQTIPVIPSADIARDVAWYQKNTGFEVYFADKMYAVIYRENLCIHLQWHADTPEDPLLGGSVVRIAVRNIQPIFEEFVQRGVVTQASFKANTPWNTHEFGFFDLNQNLIFVMEDIL